MNWHGVFLVALLHVAAANYCEAPVPEFVAPVPVDSTLLQVAVVSRHGDRSPLASLPHEREERGVEWTCDIRELIRIVGVGGVVEEGDVTGEFDSGPAGAFSARVWNGNCTVGELTLRGAEQCAAMGRGLRRVYVDKLRLIPGLYSPALVYVRTTDLWRTQQSATSMMLGLYPPSTRSGQPVVLHMAPWPVDPLIPNTAACPRAGQLQALARKDPEWVDRMSKLQPTLNKANDIAGTRGTSWDDKTTVGKWHDTLRARTCHGLPLPCKGATCITEAEARAVFEQGDWECYRLFSGNESATLHAGTWLSYIGSVMDKRARTGEGYPYMHFSAHDSTLSMTLAALGVTPKEFPPYASTLRFELWRKPSGEIAVHVIWNNVVVRPSGCSADMCSLGEWTELTSALAIRDLDKQCALQQAGAQYAEPNQAYRA